MAVATETTIQKMLEDIKNNQSVFYATLGTYKQVFYTLQLLEHEIQNCNLSEDLSYLLGTITYLYKSLNLGNSEKENVYKELQNIRTIVKNILLQKKYIYKENYKIFIKLLGKMEILSLNLAKCFDESYDESKTELLYYLIFSIKNINVLRDVIVKKPHHFNTANSQSILLIKAVVTAYLDSLSKYISCSTHKYFDDLVYFDEVLKSLLNSEKERLSIKEIRIIDNMFEKASNKFMNKSDLVSENIKRYCFFIDKWRHDFFEFIVAKSKKQDIPDFGKKTDEELFYIYNVHPDFDFVVRNDSKFIYRQHEFLKEKSNSETYIYTIDDDPGNVEIMEIDDGFSCSLKNGIYHLGIHISNPLGYAPFYHIIFQEALRKTTSIYIHRGESSKTFPMFDDILATDLFSLKEGKVRKAISFYYDIDLKNQEIVNFYYKFENICVQKNLSYETSNLFLQKQLKERFYVNTVNLIQDLYPFLRNYYHMDPLYQKINRSQENVSATNITSSLKSAKIVECLMIFNNRMVSEYASEQDLPFLYRNHTLSSSKEDLQYFRELLSKKKNSTFYLNEIRALENMYDKSKYGIECLGHQGIGIPSYCHVTSPIRRVADLMNIYMLNLNTQHMKDSDREQWRKRLEELAEYINEQSYSLNNFVREYSFHRH